MPKIIQTAPLTTAPKPATASNRRGDRNESQTVLRACEVLKAFRSLGEELSLTEVIERTRLPKTTVYR
ncbi:MAG: helix-turn-helix domain-containing protein [Acidobacteriota bacterium]|nr:helix-turn-helix domain-containing protein [Acidobacteriota bacterium]